MMATKWVHALQPVKHFQPLQNSTPVVTLSQSRYLATCSPLPLVAKSPMIIGLPFAIFSAGFPESQWGSQLGKMQAITYHLSWD